MPYKDEVKRKEYHSSYNKTLSSEQRLRKKETNSLWWKTDKGQYKSHQRRALRMNISFEISFEDWLEIWSTSGHYKERGPLGYVMCRYKDEGPYSKKNVYIAHASKNKQDAWFNNKIATPTGIFYKDLS